MELVSSILSCLCGGQSLSSKHHQTTDRSDDDIASEIVDILYNTEKRGDALQAQLHGVVQANGWREWLAEAVFNALEVAVRAGRVMGPVLKEAYDKAVEAAGKIEKFAEENPMLCAIIALGILALLTPWMLEALGFGIDGIIESSMAARWQSSVYGAWVPKGSLFSYLQSLGTKLHWY